jgi:hypothetical protein
MNVDTNTPQSSSSWYDVLLAWTTTLFMNLVDWYVASDNGLHIYHAVSTMVGLLTIVITVLRIYDWFHKRRKRP